ncbi:MAG: DoxX family protein [Capnocytophaga sp.]|nr:DoxX family protein [Capnocytophaga sp.]
MKPLFILLAVFLCTALLLKWRKRPHIWRVSGSVALSAMFLFTAMGHFLFTEGMAMMIPDFIPYRTEIVYLTGVLEILFAIGILLPKTRKFTAWSIIVFLILVLPANIYAAMHNVDYQTATHNGNGLEYLWFRIPFQLLLIFWSVALTGNKSVAPSGELPQGQ